MLMSRAYASAIVLGGFPLPLSRAKRSATTPMSPRPTTAAIVVELSLRRATPRGRSSSSSASSSRPRREERAPEPPRDEPARAEDRETGEAYPPPRAGVGATKAAAGSTSSTTASASEASNVKTADPIEIVSPCWSQRWLRNSPFTRVPFFDSRSTSLTRPFTRRTTAWCLLERSSATCTALDAPRPSVTSSSKSSKTLA